MKELFYNQIGENSIIYNQLTVVCPQSVKIGKNVSYIDNNAFTDFKGTLIIDPENPYYTVKDGVVVKLED